jgi:hypothetical protein
LANVSGAKVIETAIANIKPHCNKQGIDICAGYSPLHNAWDIYAHTNDKTTAAKITLTDAKMSVDFQAFVTNVIDNLLCQLKPDWKEPIFHKVGEAAPAFEPLQIPSSVAITDGVATSLGQFTTSTGSFKSFYSSIADMNATTSSYMGISRNPAPAKQPETMEELYAVELGLEKPKATYSKQVAKDIQQHVSESAAFEAVKAKMAAASKQMEADLYKVMAEELYGMKKPKKVKESSE